MGQHISIQKSPAGDEAVCWVGKNEEDALHMSGEPHTVDAFCRALRVAEGLVEHELAQRGANREPFVDDLTAAQLEQKAKADAEAKAASETDANMAKVKEMVDVIEKAKAVIASLAPALAAPAALAQTEPAPSDEKTSA